MQSLPDWLRQIDLERYAPVFAENDVDLEALRFLTESDLEKLGVSLGHRKKLLNAIAELNPGQAPAAQTIQAGSPTLESVSTQAERRQLTVLFCDLVGSTALAQKLDPEQLRDLMQAYQRACSQVIARYEGHVAQYLGDGLVVYFGWPRAHEDDAVRAIRAGLEAVEAVARLTSSAPIRARVGIHTGVVVVGKTEHEDASVPNAAVGDTPNIAARLQALAEPGSVVVSERTRVLAGGLFDYVELGAPPLKGVSETLRLFRVAGTRVIESRFDASRSGIALTPLVGREEEIALLLRRWQEAREGEGQVVLVGGEPGVGKSRLARALRDTRGYERYLVLRYQCSPFHVSSALYPVIDHLERAAGFGREDTPEHKLDKLQALLAGSETQVADAAPLFAALLSLPLERYPPLNLSPQKQKEKTLEALARQVEALAQRQPLLVIYEDAHWIDPTSQEALDLLVPRLQRLPVLLILTYRPEYSPRWSEQAHVTILGLSHLGRRHGSELISKLTDGKTLPQEVLDQILARADGVPLFIEELTKSVLESGLLREDRDGYVLQAPLAALAIPTTLRDSLIARLDRLAPIREVAQIGACIGREFSFELLSALSSMEGPRLEDALDQLTSTGLVFRRGTSTGAMYTFKHALVQDAAYDSLLKSTRQQLHSKIARVLEERFPTTRDTQPETLAHHYTAAGLTEDAIGYWRKAGELALQRVALHEAVAHLNRGLELVGTLPVSPGRDARELALRTSLGTAWLGLRGWAAPEVEASFTPALKLAKSLDHRPSYRPVLNGLYMYALAGGRIAESVKWVGEVQRAAEALDDLALRLLGHRLAQVTHFYLGHFEEARWHSDRIAALYSADQERDSERLTNFYALNSRGVYGAPGLWLLGYPDQALRLYQATRAHARARGHPFGLCFVLTVGSWVCELRGELDPLLADVEEGERLGRAHGIPLFSEVLGPLYKGVAWLRKGRTSEGLSQLRDALDRWTTGGAQVVVPYWKAVLAEGIARTGDLEQGLGLIEECFAQMERPGWEERWPLAEVLRIKGWMLKLQGKLDEAGQHLRASIDVARQQQAKSWELRSATTLAALLAFQGDRGAARDLLAPVYGWFTEGLDTQDLKQAKAVLEELS